MAGDDSGARPGENPDPGPVRPKISQTQYQSDCEKAKRTDVKQYLDLLRKVREEGCYKGDRTGTGTQSLFGYQMRYDLGDGFPVLTTKKLHLKSIIYELLWFLQGDTNIAYLKQHGVRIWDEWADENGDLGPVYGAQWRSWPAPDGRCQLYQRSADIFLGVPFNIASYALLTMMVAQVCELELGDFVHTLGDAHLYVNHQQQADLQLQREPLALPTMKINPAVKDLFAFRFEDFELVGYEAHPHIKAPVAV